LDEFEKKTFEANADGSIGLTVPHYVTGPNGEEIEPGDTVSVTITNVEKQADRDN
jgi:acetamidase/formamidase